jgi:SAM-dependent methyltransferase
VTGAPGEFSRADYRRQGSRPDRLQREGPFLLDFLKRSPREGPVLDVGCGTGEHTRFFAARGYPSLGMDRSRDAFAGAFLPLVPAPSGWIRGDLRDLPFESRCARAAVCLGNTLVILEEDDAILAALREIHRVLRGGGGLCLQVLNYHRLRSRNIRNLPLNFQRPEGGSGAEGAETAYLRLMDFEDPVHVGFLMLRLRLSWQKGEASVEDVSLRRLRSLEHDALARLLDLAGFDRIQIVGDYSGSAFEPLESGDVIATAWKKQG